MLTPNSASSRLHMEKYIFRFLGMQREKNEWYQSLTVKSYIWYSCARSKSQGEISLKSLGLGHDGKVRFPTSGRPHLWVLTEEVRPVRNTQREPEKVFAVTLTVNRSCHCAVCLSEWMIAGDRSVVIRGLTVKPKKQSVGVVEWLHSRLLHHLLPEEGVKSGKWKLCWKGAFSRAWA